MKRSVLKNKTLNPLLICLDNLKMISDSPSESTREAEIDCVTKRQVIHAPAIAYHIRNAVLVGGSIYAGNLKHFVCLTRHWPAPHRLFTS